MATVNLWDPDFNLAVGDIGQGWRPDEPMVVVFDGGRAQELATELISRRPRDTYHLTVDQGGQRTSGWLYEVALHPGKGPGDAAWLKLTFRPNIEWENGITHGAAERAIKRAQEMMTHTARTAEVEAEDAKLAFDRLCVQHFGKLPDTEIEREEFGRYLDRRDLA